MCPFIAGATKVGQLTEIAIVDRASSAIPFAIFPIMFAVAGTTASRSA